MKKEKENPLREIRFRTEVDSIWVSKKPKERKVILEFGSYENGDFQLILTPFQAEKLIMELIELSIVNYENKYNFSIKKKRENFSNFVRELERDLKLYLLKRK